MPKVAGVDIIMTIETGISGTQLQRLLTWLSPSFPVGAFSYSHGLEAAVEDGLVSDRETLAAWIRTIIATGSGRIDAALFRAAWTAIDAEDPDLLDCALERGDALQATSELGLETTAQGAAFLSAAARHWPHIAIDHVCDRVEALDRRVVYPVAVGSVAAAHDVALLPALEAYLHAFAANIVSAGVRLIPLGQSDGLHVLATLEPEIVAAARVALDRAPEDIGSAAFMVDWASSIHETQYTRLFRS